MASRFDYFYLVEIQYLGFRYHGWQFQHGLKTLQGMLEKTFTFLFKDEKFKILGSGRTDAMVSAQSAYFELFTNQELDLEAFQKELDENLPPDIKVINIKTVDNKFNVIQDVIQKTYHYYFASVEEKYPFASPFMNCLQHPLDFSKMKEAAKLFEGEREFKYFMVGESENKNTVRKIKESRIEENMELTASFFPQESFVFIVTGKGFMRYQIRLMMGALIRVGRNEISLQDLENALQGNPPSFEKLNAAASGLMVKEVEFK
ncbi:tRNA pseudouridine(38-40) synthase TruA [Marivirga salinae]|uniref:tRNA pseudouridine synthase A n=1 Tax=Marivirga salinarum TaxID=3059078 RepID=A0AA51NBW3_9BACT|nr:tRNA pseudouridine(38-40) synthase TruA [Marivirga sp. BDSF4-3]WMN10780.1 tRNA pseudouridine(38-40) synthase TruA [Marivirga sp. BDSF4-3]